MKMYKNMLMVASTGVLLGVTGCDWSSGGGADGYNSDVPFDVSGAYRNGGVPVVFNYNSEGRNTSASKLQVAQANGTRTITFELPNDNITPGSVLITVADISYTDPAGNGELVASGTPGASSTPNGRIAYDGGAVFLDYRKEVPAGTPIYASYGFGSSAANVASGASRTTITAFTVQQLGNTVTFTDNNGDQYTGKLGGARVNSQTEDQLNRSIQFQVEGSSRGVPVKMVGIFTAIQNVDREVVAVADDQGAFAGPVEVGRFIDLYVEGTYIEPSASANLWARVE